MGHGYDTKYKADSTMKLRLNPDMTFEMSLTDVYYKFAGDPHGNTWARLEDQGNTTKLFSGEAREDNQIDRETPGYDAFG